MTPLDREGLDNREMDDPFHALADMFNDYEHVVFQNATIKYVDGLPTTPFQAVSSLGTLANSCWELNPSDMSRPDRDGAWIRKNWKVIRATLTKIREDFKKSGQQDAENIYDEWFKFSGDYGDVYTYAIAVLDWSIMDQLGKALPDAVQRDTGESDNHGTKRPRSDSLGAINRRRQRAIRKEMMGSNVSSPSGSSDSNWGHESLDDLVDTLESHVEALQKKADADIKLKALTYLADHGSKRALEDIERIAFGV